MYMIFFTNTFISLTLSVHNPSVQSPCFSMTESQPLGSIVIPSKTPLLFMCRITRVLSVESSSTEDKRRVVKVYVLLTLGISLRLVDSCMDCRVHEETLPTHVYVYLRFYGASISEVIGARNEL